jgi:arylsulfatase A-like enzyme/Tfp pilus assembly protein PilF
MLGAVLLAAALAPAALRPPDVVVISIDTLRPDALGWVSGRNATPAIDALAKEGFRFPAAVSPAPLTLPAHTSLLSGLVPRRHGVRDNGQVLGASPRLLTEVLKDRGYDTGAFVSGYPLRAPFGLARGFDVFDDAVPTRGDDWQERRAADTTAAALRWVRARGDRPLFLFVHYYDPHDPYDPPARLRGTGPRGAYDGEVRAVDEAVGVLRKGLAARGRPAVTILTGDHGESLGAHGEDAHGFFVYDATLLVPLVVHAPGRVPAGESAAPARLVDVAPTVLDLVDAPGLSDTDGVSLRPLLSGRPQEVPPAYAESQQPWLGYGWAPLAAVRTAGEKLVLAPRPELYDLARDPDERKDLASARPADVARLTALARQAEARGTAPSVRADDPQTAERLRALGYVGGAAAPGSAPPADAADPKDRLREKALLADADASLRARDHAGALARFDAVLATEPDNRFALLRSAAALAALGRGKEAIPRLERLVRLAPDLGEARYQLADALTRAGDRRRAAEQWAETVRLEPRRAAAWSNLGTVLFQGGQVARAAEAFERASAIAPQDRTFADNLGACRYELALLELAAGRPDAARKRLADALLVAPSLRRKAASDPRLSALFEE